MEEKQASAILQLLALPEPESDWIEEHNKKIWHSRIRSIITEFRQEQQGFRTLLTTSPSNKKVEKVSSVISKKT